MANLITRVNTWLNGEFVGEDFRGNKYYQERKPVAGRRRRRWALYRDGSDEPTEAPPEWHAWLHYTIDAFPDKDAVHPREWERAHLPNATGTPGAYRPPGHTLKGGRRDPATGDYEAWTPE